MPIWEFVKQWQKNAMLVVHKPGEKVKEFSPLSLTEADIELGELNDQIIRSQESRQPQIPRLRLIPAVTHDVSDRTHALHLQRVVDRADVEAGHAEDHQDDHARPRGPTRRSRQSW